MSEPVLWMSVLFGSIGMGFFIYGKKQSAPVHLLCGLGLMVFPMFVSKPIAVLVVGVVLSVAPFILPF